MDLGATICTPRAPRCMACPLAPSCAAFALEAPERFPARPPRRLRPLRRATAWWIEAGGAVALVRRPATGLLGGMMALPGTGFGTDPDPDAPPPFPADWRRLPGAVRHGFTHFELELAVAVAETPEPFPRLAGEALRWVPLADLPGLGLPTLYRRAADAVLAWRGPGRAAA
jgi:A/G-specific adenine glycosylase